MRNICCTGFVLQVFILFYFPTLCTSQGGTSLPQLILLGFRFLNSHTPLDYSVSCTGSIQSNNLGARALQEASKARGATGPRRPRREGRGPRGAHGGRQEHRLRNFWPCCVVPHTGGCSRGPRGARPTGGIQSKNTLF